MNTDNRSSVGKYNNSFAKKKKTKRVLKDKMRTHGRREERVPVRDRDWGGRRREWEEGFQFQFQFEIGVEKEGGWKEGMENSAPLPRVFHNTNEFGSVRHECELQSVMTS